MEKQLGYGDVYEEDSDDPEPLISTMYGMIKKKLRKWEVKEVGKLKIQNLLDSICYLKYIND